MNKLDSLFLRWLMVLLMSSTFYTLLADDVTLRFMGSTSSGVSVSTGDSIIFTPEGLKVSSVNTLIPFNSFTAITLFPKRTDIIQPSDRPDSTTPVSTTTIDVVFPDPTYPKPVVLGEIESTVYDLADAAVTVKTPYVYTGKPIIPDYSVTYKSTVLKEGADYTSVITNNINVGTATITFTGKGNYMGTKSLPFTITAAPIENADVVFKDGTEFSYTGEAILPRFTISYGGIELKSNSDYSFEYKDNINAGNATLTIVGMRNFAGSKKIPFTITPITLYGADIVLDNTEFAYTGDSIKPNLSVKLGDVELKKDSDYRISYEHNVTPGTAFVTICGIGNYKDELTTTFDITNPYTITLMVDSVVVEPRIQPNGNDIQAVYDGYYKFTNSLVINGYRASVGDTVTLVLRPVVFCNPIVTMTEDYKVQRIRNDIYAYKFARPLGDVVINLHFEVDSVRMDINNMQEMAVDHYIIYDARGQKVDDGMSNSRKDVLDRVKRHPQGLYIIKINNKTLKVYRK